MTQFRTVTIVQPDLHLTLEVMLCSQGNRVWPVFFFISGKKNCCGKENYILYFVKSKKCWISAKVWTSCIKPHNFLGKILGFIHGRELAKKTMMVYEMCRKLLGTTQFISEEMTQGKDNDALQSTVVLTCWYFISPRKILTKENNKKMIYHSLYWKTWRAIFAFKVTLYQFIFLAK